MSTQLRIDFVSDISCPWCVIGLKALEQALLRTAGEFDVDLQFQPFELNPQMAAEGEEIGAHLARKYGASAEQGAATRAMIAQRGAEVGFHFDMATRSRIYNTFDAHRLLYWAGLQGRQQALEHALFEAYFTRGESPAAFDVLAAAAAAVGLDPAAATELLESGRYGPEVREREQFFHSQGISAVPAVIINGRHLISGAQPSALYAQALRQIAQQDAPQ